jgi:hypothetical protein
MFASHQKVSTVNQMHQLGLTVKAQVEKHGLVTPKDIIDWRSETDLQSAEKKQSQIELHHNIQNIRRFVNQAIMQDKLCADAPRSKKLISALTVAKFHVGRCMELSALAQLMLCEAAFEVDFSVTWRQLYIQNDAQPNIFNHTFLIFGPNLPVKINDLTLLNDMPETVFVYDPFLKILDKANKFLSHKEFKDINETVKLNLQRVYTDPNDNIFSKLVIKEVRDLRAQVNRVFDHVVFGLQDTIENAKSLALSPEQFKVLTDLLILAQNTKMEVVKTLVEPVVKQEQMSRYYLFHLQHSTQNKDVQFTPKVIP